MVDTSFMDAVVFPEHISRGSVGGPDWPAEIVELSAGREERNTHIASPLRTYDARYGVRKPNEAHQVLSLYLVAMGRLRGFRFKDWTDFRSGPPATAPTALDQPLGTGDGEATVFALNKLYTVETLTFERRITRPRAGVLVAVDGEPLESGFAVDLATGTVTFDAAPADEAELTWGGEFDVPVRFDCALSQIEMNGPVSGIPSILLKELRE
jgi:uncharacterized protein (TIGR02217 family)